MNETISALCTDIDESIDGKEDATCFDTNGSYECQCEDGYIYDATEKGCIGKLIIKPKLYATEKGCKDKLIIKVMKVI